MFPSPPYRRRLPRVLALAVAASLAPGASAQQPEQEDAPPRDLTELSLEELMQLEVRPVRGASLKLETTVEAPSAVTVVTREDIAAMQVRTLAELLATVGGFYVTDDRNYVRLGVRGFQIPGDYNSRVLLLVDGHHLNDPVYGSASIGREFPIDLDLVERVEIIRGPGSALYGSNAIFAVVNVITRDPASIGGAEAAARAGSFGSYELRGTWADGDEHGGWIASVDGYDSKGDSHFYPQFSGEPGGGHTDGTDYESAVQAFFAWRAGELSLQTVYGEREKGLPTGSYDTVFDDPDNRTTDTYAYVDLAWRRELDDGREVEARLVYDQYDYRGWYVYDDTGEGGPPDLLNRDLASARTVGAYGHGSLRVGERHELTLGAEVVRSFDVSQKNWDDLYGDYLDSSRTEWRAGVFAQDDVTLRDDLSLVAGARYDDYNTFGGTLNPRVALVWRRGPEDVWKLLYGTAFRAPNAYELYYGDGDAQKANPDLDPERITTLEAVWEGSVAAGLRARCSAFYYVMRDLIVQEVDPLDDLLVFRNTNRVDAKGLELSASKVFAGGRRVQLDQTIVNVEDQSTGADLPNSPRYVAQARLRQPLFGGAAELDLGVRYLSSRDTVAGDTVSPYAVVDAGVRVPELGDHLELSFGVRNALDKTYSDPVGAELVQDALQRDGRTFLVGLTYRP